MNLLTHRQNHYFLGNHSVLFDHSQSVNNNVTDDLKGRSLDEESPISLGSSCLELPKIARRWPSCV